MTYIWEVNGRPGTSLKLRLRVQAGDWVSTSAKILHAGYAGTQEQYAKFLLTPKVQPDANDNGTREAELFFKVGNTGIEILGLAAKVEGGGGVVYCSIEKDGELMPVFDEGIQQNSWVPVLTAPEVAKGVRVGRTSIIVVMT